MYHWRLRCWRMDHTVYDWSPGSTFAGQDLESRKIKVMGRSYPHEYEDCTTPVLALEERWRTIEEYTDTQIVAFRFMQNAHDITYLHTYIVLYLASM